MTFDKLIDLSTVLSGIAAFIGIVVLAWQVRGQTRIARSKFVNDLCADIDSNIPIESQLDPGGAYFDYIESLPADVQEQLEKYLNFFERVYYIHRVGGLALDTIDGLYSYRFFHLVHNPNVIFHVIRDPAMEAHFIPLYQLHRPWVSYRRKKRKKIPRECNLKLLMDNDGYHDR